MAITNIVTPVQGCVYGGTSRTISITPSAADSKIVCAAVVLGSNTTITMNRDSGGATYDDAPDGTVSGLGYLSTSNSTVEIGWWDGMAASSQTIQVTSGASHVKAFLFCFAGGATGGPEDTLIADILDQVASSAGSSVAPVTTASEDAYLISITGTEANIALTSMSEVTLLSDSEGSGGSSLYRAGHTPTPGDTTSGEKTNTITWNSNFGAKFGIVLSFAEDAGGGGTESETDGFDLGDGGVYGVARSASDGFDLGESVSVSGAGAASDGLSAGDAVLYGLARAVTDGIVLAETVSYGTPRSSLDGLVVGDSTRYGESRAASDGILLGQDIATVHTVDAGPDGFVLGDSVQDVATVPANITDGFELGDSPVYGSDRVGADGLTLGDASTGSLAQAFASVTDGLEIGDNVDTGTAATRAETDGFTLGDAGVGLFGAAVSVTDGFVAGDSNVVLAFRAAAVSDGISVGESAAFRGGYRVSITDGILLGDAVTSVGSAQLRVVPLDMKPGTGRANILGD